MSTAETPVAETVYAAVAPVYVEPRGYSVASFVLGLSSLAFGFTFIVPVAGLILGIMAFRHEPSSRTLSVWGIVLSGISLAGGVVAVLLGLTLLVPAGLLAVFAG